MSAIPLPLGLALHGTGVVLALVLRRHAAACRWAAFLASAGGAIATFGLGATVLVLALTSALAAACFVKGFAVTFLARPRSRAAAEATESRVLLLGPQAFLAPGCVALGLFPGVVLPVLAGVAASLPGIGPQPTREVSTVETAPCFASEVRYRSQMGAPFERHVYGPATRAVLAAAGRLRVIQAGSLHAYLAYVLVLGVILLWWLGGLP